MVAIVSNVGGVSVPRLVGSHYHGVVSEHGKHRYQTETVHVRMDQCNKRKRTDRKHQSNHALFGPSSLRTWRCVDCSVPPSMASILALDGSRARPRFSRIHERRCLQWSSALELEERCYRVNFERGVSGCMQL